jgi:hypothetical protein
LLFSAPPACVALLFVPRAAAAVRLAAPATVASRRGGCTLQTRFPRHHAAAFIAAKRSAPDFFSYQLAQGLPQLSITHSLSCCIRLTIACSDGRVLLFEAQEDDANVSLRQVSDVKVGEGAIMSLFWSTDSRSATADGSHPAAYRLAGQHQTFLA